MTAEATGRDAPPGHETAPSRVGAVTASLVLAVFAYSFQQMLVIPALPVIQEDLHVGAGSVVWLQSVFLMTTAIGTPILGVVGDRYGRRRMLVLVLCLFAGGAVLGALSPSLPWLITARAIQGLGGAVVPLCFGLARQALPARRIPVTVGLISATFGVGGAFGMVAAGPLIDRTSWHSVFLAGAAAPLLAAGLAMLILPKARASAAPAGRMDWFGGVLLAAALTPLLLVVSQARSWGWASASTLALGLGGAAIAVAWFVWERRHPSPLIDLRLMAGRNVWPLHLLAACVGFGMYGGMYVLSLLFQQDPGGGQAGHGLSATAASLLLLPALVSGFPAGTLAGVVGGRRGSRLPLFLGLATMVIGYALLVGGLDQLWMIVLGAVLAQGMGLNMTYTAIANLVVAGAPAEQAAESTGVNTSMRTIGGAIGSQVLGALVESGTASGFAVSFAVCGVVLVLVTVASLGRIPRA